MGATMRPFRRQSHIGGAMISGGWNARAGSQLPAFDAGSSDQLRLVRSASPPRKLNGLARRYSGSSAPYSPKWLQAAAQLNPSPTRFLRGNGETDLSEEMRKSPAQHRHGKLA